MLTVPEASAQILADIVPLSEERVGLLAARGRVLAVAVASPLTIPPWDNSAMDGYAVQASDVTTASPERPVTLRVLETVAAGQFPTAEVGPGEAVRIMTGAPIPQGADSVVRSEDTDEGQETVQIRDGRDAGHNVRPRGEDIPEGQTVLPAGTPIGPAQIGVLASVGAAAVAVHRRPRVALLGSGDEIVDLDRFDEVLAGRKVVSSNSYSLHALVQSAGGEPVDLGIVPDDPEILRSALRAATACDLVVTTGGISVGAFDYTRDVFESLGGNLKFWRVRIRPGAPLGFGFLAGTPWIGLPGNPVSTMVTFELFVRPVIRRMLGHAQLFRRSVQVLVDETVSISGRLMHFLRAIVTAGEDGTLHARLTGPQGSAILTSMARANALLIVPEDRSRIEAGEVALAILLTEDATFSSEFRL